MEQHWPGHWGYRRLGFLRSLDSWIFSMAVQPEVELQTGPRLSKRLCNRATELYSVDSYP